MEPTWQKDVIPYELLGGVGVFRQCSCPFPKVYKPGTKGVTNALLKDGYLPRHAQTFQTALT